MLLGDSKGLYVFGLMGRTDFIECRRHEQYLLLRNRRKSRMRHFTLVISVAILSDLLRLTF